MNVKGGGVKLGCVLRGMIEIHNLYCAILLCHKIICFARPIKKERVEPRLNSRMEKLHFAFRMYDLDGDDKISKVKITISLRAINPDYIFDFTRQYCANEIYYIVDFEIPLPLWLEINYFLRCGGGCSAKKCLQEILRHFSQFF